MPITSTSAPPGVRSAIAPWVDVIPKGHLRIRVGLFVPPKRVRIRAAWSTGTHWASAGLPRRPTYKLRSSPFFEIIVAWIPITAADL
jgi:hypothetical protein